MGAVSKRQPLYVTCWAHSSCSLKTVALLCYPMSWNVSILFIFATSPRISDPLPVYIRIHPDNLASLSLAGFGLMRISKLCLLIF